MTQNPDPALDIDTLLAGGDPDPAGTPPAQPTTPVPPPPPAEDDAVLAQIASLESVLASIPQPAAPVSDAALSPEQQQLRDLQDRAVRQVTALKETVGPRYDTTEGEETILLHFLEDGLTIAGQMWYRGQELEFVVGSEAHQQQFDRFGKSWLDLIDDPGGQVRRWGKHYFSRGPWPYTTWSEAASTLLTDPEEIAMARAAAEAEQRRGRRPPLIN